MLKPVSKEIQRKCNIGGIVGDCTHHELKYRPPLTRCSGCIIASHNGGKAVDLPDARKEDFNSADSSDQKPSV